ncbi:MAG: hypothetical protein ABIO05_08945 [Ferruginibacter sp.]
MTKNTKNILVFSVGLLVLTAGLIGFNMYNKGPVNVGAANAITINPDVLYKEYITDSSTAHKKYDGKVVVLTGMVKDESQNAQKQQVIILATTQQGGNINCTLEQPAKVTIGKPVTIKGICSGIGEGDAELGIAGDVYLTRSLVIN